MVAARSDHLAFCRSTNANPEPDAIAPSKNLRKRVLCRDRLPVKRPDLRVGGHGEHLLPIRRRNRPDRHTRSYERGLKIGAFNGSKIIRGNTTNNIGDGLSEPLELCGSAPQ